MPSLLLKLIASASLSLIPLNDATDRGVFVFGPLLLDFRENREVLLQTARLANCSTERFFCVDGGVVNFVLPRECGPIAVGDTWRSGGLETTVIGRTTIRNPHYPHLSEPGFYVHTNVEPTAVFLYVPSAGVRRIFYDLRGRTDFVSRARNGTLDAFFLEAIRDPLRQHLVMSRITLDTLAECRRGARPAGASADPRQRR